MPKWFGRGGDTTVPREWRTALDKTLRAVLDPIKPGLSSRLTDFVVDGSPASALQDLGSATHLGGGFGMYGVGSGDLPQQTRVLCEGLAEVPPEVGLRLARVIETGSRHAFFGQASHLQWAEAMLLHFSGSLAAHPGVPNPQTLPLEFATLEAISVAAGRPATEPLVAAFASNQSRTYYGFDRYRHALRSLRDYAGAVDRHAEVLRPALATTKADDRLIILAMLKGLPAEVLAKFVEELADYATSTSGKVRSGALPLLGSLGAAAVAPLQRIASAGKPDARLHALQLLHAMDDPAVRAWAESTAAADRAASVRALAEQWSRVEAEVREADVPPLTVERPRIDWRVEVTPHLREQLAAVVEEANTAIRRTNAQAKAHAEQWAAQHGSKPTWLREIPEFEPGWLKRVIGSLEAGRPPVQRDASRIAVHHMEQPLLRMLPSSGLDAAGVTILLSEIGWLTWSNSISPTAIQCFNVLLQESGSPSLLELDTMLGEMGLDGGDLVLRAYLHSWSPLGSGLPDEAVAPFVTANLDRVLLPLSAAERDYSVVPLRVYDLLATLPALPPGIVDQLFATAVGARKTERRPAQDALARVPGIEERIITALSNGKGEVRATAAEWLGRLRHEPAIPVLEKAVAKEKQDVAMGAMLDALQALGQPVEKYLDRDALALSAKKALAKGLPKDLVWFPWDGLPTVRWADSGEPVGLEVLQWFLAQAVKAKSAEPNAVLRKYCAMFDPTDREAFGQFVLEAWVAEDLRPIDPELAHQEAAQQAAQTHQWMRQWPQAYQDDPLRNATVEQLTAAYLPRHLRRPAGSAASAKGVLAVAAACAGERAAPVAQRYLKEWYGQRASQGRALIVMLAWIEHPSATQLMLSVGSRFRTKSFQEEATRQAELLAERKGWTVAELSDRTIPTAGFDESGVLELSYGDRVFTARLLPDLTVELRSPEGATIKALPTPRQSDDDQAAKDAKKALAASKKELKSVVTLQAERLYEALCTERSWDYEDWQRYLLGHPVMRHLVQRLAWVATVDDEPVVFRPLDDGTLTDVDDEPVELPADAKVAVAHDSVLDAEQVAAWQQHFADYEVTPLFQQFGKGGYALPEQQRREQELKDFEGHLVESFALRGRANRLGYTRGNAEDGGWFYVYEKRFPTLGITAVIEFTGNFLPETNRTVALRSLSFLRSAPGGQGAKMRLSEVPAILLSEAWNDMRLMAADGSGFAPDWEKKVEY